MKLKKILLVVVFFSLLFCLHFAQFVNVVKADHSSPDVVLHWQARFRVGVSSWVSIPATFLIPSTIEYDNIIQNNATWNTITVRVEQNKATMFFDGQEVGTVEGDMTQYVLPNIQKFYMQVGGMFGSFIGPFPQAGVHFIDELRINQLTGQTMLYDDFEDDLTGWTLLRGTATISDDAFFSGGALETQGVSLWSPVPASSPLGFTFSVSIKSILTGWYATEGSQGTIMYYLVTENGGFFVAGYVGLPPTIVDLEPDPTPDDGLFSWWILAFFEDDGSFPWWIIILIVVALIVLALMSKGKK